MDQLYLAELARASRCQPQVDKERTRVWRRWLAYLANIGKANDPFLERLDGSEQNTSLKPVIIGGFAQALRSGELQERGKKSVVGETVRSNLDSLVQTFRTNKKRNPTLDSDGKFSALLSWQISGFKGLDPAPKRQKAVSIKVLKAMEDLANSPAAVAAADLAMAAFFFACRSCEYIQVTGPRRTKPIRVGDVQFRQGKLIISHDSPELHLAETVSVIFRDQKNRSKYQTRTAWATTDPKANPVIAWSKVVRRVRATPSCKESTDVYHFCSDSGDVDKVESDLMITQLRAAVAHLGESALGYSPADIGTHSIRSGAAMALVLSGHAAWRIMLAGRWKSSAFLVYIREQVQAFSRGVSERMIENPDFFHVPDLDRLDASTSTPTTSASPLEANAFNGGASNNYQVLNVDFFG
jgi:hypothetical protein